MDEELNFYYNRERRLESAPQSVKDLYKEPVKNKLGLLGPLIADRPRRIMFFVIIFLCALIFALSRMGYLDSYHSLEGNRLDVSGLIVGENTIVIIKKTIMNAEPYTGALDVAVSIPVKDPGASIEDISVFYHRVYLTLEKIEEFRFVVPFNANELLMVLQSEKSALQLNFKID